MTKHVRHNRSRKAEPADLYRWLIVCAGALAVFDAAWHLQPGRFDPGLLVLAALAALTSLYLAIPVPRFDTNITVSDTFIFFGIVALRERIGSTARSRGRHLRRLAREQKQAPSNDPLQRSRRRLFGVDDRARNARGFRRTS